MKAKLIIEVDGATHAHDTEIAHDERRTAFLNRAGWRVLRVSNLDVYSNLSGVVSAIDDALAPLVGPADPSLVHAGYPPNS